MSVFSTDSILESRIKKQVMFSSSENILSEKSCFLSEALEYIKEENINFNKLLLNETDFIGFGRREANREVDKIRKGIIESIIDRIYKIIKKIFDTFENFFSDLIDKFKMLFVKIGNKDKAIMANKDLLLNFPTQLPYAQERYLFNHIDPQSCDVMSNMFNVDINGFFKDVSSYVMNNTFMNPDNDYTSSYVESKLANIRSKLVGKFDDSATKATFSQDLYSYHRERTEQTMDNFVEASEIAEIYRYNYIDKSPEKVFKSLQSLKARIKNSSNNVLNQIKRIKSDKTKEFSNKDDKQALMSYVQLVTQECKEICNIYLLAVSSKMDAVKDKKIQDINILISAINAEKGILGGKL